MPDVLEPPPRRPDAPGQDRPTAAEVESAVLLADRTLHFGALLARGGTYLALGTIADRFAFGPHLLAGALFGDFAGSVLAAVRTAQAATAATVAELLLFALLFALWWHRYAWPATPEFQALFYLACIGALTARVAAIAAAWRGDDGWS